MDSLYFNILKTELPNVIVEEKKGFDDAYILTDKEGKHPLITIYKNDVFAGTFDVYEANNDLVKGARLVGEHLKQERLMISQVILVVETLHNSPSENLH